MKTSALRSQPVAENPSHDSPAGWVVGIDIGGTFTDGIACNLETGDLRTAKVLSTSHDPSVGFMDVLSRLMDGDGPAAARVAHVVHATTVATNAIIEGNLARTAFITTKGFRDILEIQRQIRPKLYDLSYEKPAAIVPRELSYTLDERVLADGSIAVPLNEQELIDVLHALVDHGAEAVGVCLINSYRNSHHEEAIREIAARNFPDLVITLSSQIAPRLGEYRRATTAVINAGITPVVRTYLRQIERSMSVASADSRLYVMQSNGGFLDSVEIQSVPCQIIESGPAAGVVAVSKLGPLLATADFITLDMGGTTAKVSLVAEGRFGISEDYEVGAIAAPGIGVMRASGYPLLTPVVDLVEVGAGGGTIAWVDAAGVLRVGPHSAGADPGPVCYGRGGKSPTVTDANLVLGRMNPDIFVGDSQRLDVKAAEEAIQRECASQMKCSVAEAAHSILEVANSHMVRAMKMVTIERGVDTSQYALIAFGGAGPLHAAAIARELSIPHLIIPPLAGLTSALGLLLADLKVDRTVTYVKAVKEIEPSVLAEHFMRELEYALRLVGGRTVQDEVSVRCSLGMRYVGQAHELVVDAVDPREGTSAPENLAARFHEIHERVYKHSAPNQDIEVVSLRITATRSVTKPTIPAVAGHDAGSKPHMKERRNVFFSEMGEFVSTPIYSAADLRRDDAITGPAIVEQSGSTVTLLPGFRLVVGAYGELHMYPEGL